METKYLVLDVKCHIKEVPPPEKKSEWAAVRDGLIILLWILVALTVLVGLLLEARQNRKAAEPAASDMAVVQVENREIATLSLLPGGEVEGANQVGIDAAEIVRMVSMAEPTTPAYIERPANPWGVPLFDAELTAMYEVCEEWHVSPELALALMWVESRFDREAVNVDCYGLCQLKERYFPGAKDMTGAENIRAGLAYLGKLLEKYDNLDAALTAYRWDHDTGDRAYASEVIDRLLYYGGMFGE